MITMNEYTYIGVMFPYPSGSGLHIGHMYNYSIMDSYARWLHYYDRKVTYQPFGYDAFGLPAENYAKKVGRDPREITEENIIRFREQMARMNTNFDEKLITSDVSYYQWTQWIFLQLLKHGLAYKAMGEVNYCPSCETVLANEQVKEGKCDRCKSEVQMKTEEQWYFKITDYKDRLIAGLDHIDYPEKTKKQQRHWLENLRDWCVSRQRKWGTPIPIAGETDTLDTFVDSSFYYIRYCDAKNPNKLAEWDAIHQVDIYVGGNEHACMHLIYARFINMFLYDIGVTPFEEPFKKVIHQGMITNKGHKMSKSEGNTINPDDYDPDELRMYLMFIGHYFDGGDWNDQNINGIKRFIARMNKWVEGAIWDGVPLDFNGLDNTLNGYFKSFKFNKVISTLMEFYNANKKTVNIDLESAKKLCEIMRVVAPNFAKSGD